MKMLDRVIGREQFYGFLAKNSKASEYVEELDRLLLAFESMYRSWRYRYFAVKNDLPGRQYSIWHEDYENPIPLSIKLSFPLIAYGESINYDFNVFMPAQYAGLEPEKTVYDMVLHPNLECVLFSGGFESVWLKNQYPNADLLTFPGIDDRSGCGVEFPAVLGAIIAGYKNIHIGLENSFEIDALCPFNNTKFIETMNKVFNVNIQTVLNANHVSKDQVIGEVIALDALETAIPCFLTEGQMTPERIGKNIQATGHSHYCGHCSKCWQTHVSLERKDVNLFHMAPIQYNKYYQRVKKVLRPVETIGEAFADLEDFSNLTAAYICPRPMFDSIRTDIEKLLLNGDNSEVYPTKGWPKYPTIKIEDYLRMKLR